MIEFKVLAQTLSVFFVFDHLLPLNNADASQCYNSQSCVSQSIMVNGSSIIECYGYRSCERALHLENIGSGNIRCYGVYSCYNATLIKQTSDVYANIECFGLFSCAKVGTIVQPYAGTMCYGEKSCYDTKILAIVPDYDVWCSGDRACQDTEIITQRDVYFQGHLSGLNSNLYSNDSFTIYQFFGAESGYNATVHCGDFHICWIFCYGNACNKLSWTQGTSSTLQFNCDQNAEFSDACPDGKYIPRAHCTVLCVVLHYCVWCWCSCVKVVLCDIFHCANNYL